MNNTLCIKGLTKTFDNFKLNNINMVIPKGSIMGLIGENGAGKTTLIKCILNLIKKDSGNINVLDFDIDNSDGIYKEYIGVVFDECLFNEIYNAKDINKIFKGIYKNWNENEFFNYIKKFNIDEKKKIKEYSKGMKMKLSIAVALSHNAKFLILDEAMSGIDPIVRNEILDIFMDFIQNDENSILISSHITSDLEKICDYITFIHNGEIFASRNKDLFIEEYGILKCGNDEFESIDKEDIVSVRKNNFSTEILVDKKYKMKNKYKNFIIDNVTLEDIMMFVIKGERV